MTEQKTEQSKSMTKWLAIAVMAVLVVAIVIITIVLAQKIGNLNRELDDANTQVTALQSKVTGLQSDVTSLQAQLTQEKARTQQLSNDLVEAGNQVASLQKDVASKQSTIDTQNTTIKTMKYPRHFSTPEELANWLQKDNTDTLYPNPTLAQKMLLALTLQIHAARDGYIICTNLPTGGQLDLVTNRAVVGDVIYEIRPWDDFAQKWNNIPAIPSYPIPPESGQ